MYYESSLPKFPLVWFSEFLPLEDDTCIFNQQVQCPQLVIVLG